MAEWLGEGLQPLSRPFESGSWFHGDLAQLAGGTRLRPVTVMSSNLSVATKLCTGCGQIKDASEFYGNKAKADGLQSRCKICSRAASDSYDRSRYAEMRAAAKAAAVLVAKQYVYEFLSTHPCVDCGIRDWRVLEFDHVRGSKRRNVSDMIVGGYRLTVIQDEIAKCEVRCANCHRIITAQRGGNWRHDFQPSVAEMD